MIRSVVFTVLMISLIISNANALEKKTIVHISTVPVTEGLGIYSSVKMIADGTTGSRVAGITNISLLAINAGLGSFIAFGKPDNYSTLRLIHHLIGFTAVGTALWLTVAASTDDRVDSHVKYISAGYAAMATVPIFIFNF